MKVSIVIPVYNAVEKLDNCLKSLLASVENDNDYEIIAINDCSTDNVIDVLDKYNIKVFHNKTNLGFIKTSNKGIKLATGDIIILLNSDTVVPMNFLPRVRQCFLQNEDCAFAAPWGGDSEINYDKQISLANLDNFIYKNWDGKYYKSVTVHGFCFCMRASVLKEIGYLDEIYGKGYFEEQDICVRALSRGYSNYFISNMYVLHHHCSSFGSSTREIYIKQNQKIFEERWDAFIKEYRKQNRNILFKRKKVISAWFPLETRFLAKSILFLKSLCKKKVLSNLQNYFEEKYNNLFFVSLKKVSENLKLSVIVPVYNEKPEYIERAIASLNNQLFQNIEIIIVDDGSKNEETIKYLNNINQENIKIFHKENGGLGSARNYGIQQASGDILSFLDADDWVEKDFYSKLMYDLTNKKTDIACGVLICDGKSFDKFPRYIASTVQEKLKYINNGYVCSKIFKKELFSNIQFPEDKLYFEDNPVLLKILCNANKVSFNPSAKYIYFINEASITRNKDYSKEQKRINDSMIILDKIKEWASSYNKEIYDLIMMTIGKILFIPALYAKDPSYCQKIKKIYNEQQINQLVMPNNMFIQNIFSIKKTKDKKYRIVTILGLKFKICRNVKEIYDIVYSIGSDCGCASNLIKFDLRKTSGPFDWLREASFEQRFNVLMTDFKDFLNKDDLKFMEKDHNAKLQDNVCDYYYNKRTNFEFLHDFKAGKSLDETFYDVKEKYTRRINRFIDNILNKKRILLVWYSLYEQLDYDLILKCHKMYCEKVNKAVDLLIVENDESIKEDMLNIIKLNSNIFIYRGKFKDNISLVDGSYKQCKKVFSNFYLKENTRLIKKFFCIKRSARYKVIKIFGIKIKIKRKY